MTVDITEIPYTDLGRNSVLLVRLPEGTQSDLKAIDELAAQLHANLGHSVVWMVTRDSTSVEHFSEEFMNRAGWYRRPTETNPA